MNKKFTRNVKAVRSFAAGISMTVVISCALVACGGGGGDNSASTSPSTPSTPSIPSTPSTPTGPTVTPGNLQTTVPAPTYAAGSQELAFYTTFNAFRQAEGLGLLAQNSKLDAADRNHLNYLLTNTDLNLSSIDPATGRPQFHIEDPKRPGFTGVQELDRATYTQYGGIYVGENGTYGSGQGASRAFASLIGGIYHRAGMMFQGPRDFGIAVGANALQTTVMTVGYVSTPQYNASDFFGTYPQANQTGVGLSATWELPNPYPDLANTDLATKTGYPINVVVKENTTLAVTIFTVTEAGQSPPMDARLFTAATDPNKELISNTAFLVAKTSFKPNTTYTVNFVGTANGTAITKTWSFTTGASN